MPTYGVDVTGGGPHCEMHGVQGLCWFNSSDVIHALPVSCCPARTVRVILMVRVLHTGNHLAPMPVTTFWLHWRMYGKHLKWNGPIRQKDSGDKEQQKTESKGRRKWIGKQNIESSWSDSRAGDEAVAWNMGPPLAFYWLQPVVAPLCLCCAGSWLPKQHVSKQSCWNIQLSSIGLKKKNLCTHKMQKSFQCSHCNPNHSN